MTEVIELWPEGAPGSENWVQAESAVTFDDPFEHRVIRNVTRPTLTVQLPDADVATGTGVVVCPGGAFHFLAVDHEGADVAEALAARGVAAFVLKYRVIETPAGDGDFLDYRNRIEQSSRAGDRDWFMSKVQSHLPLATADARRALEVVAARAEDWQLTPDRVGLMGFSAGGTVALESALALGDAAPAFVAAIYGAVVRDIVVPANAPPLFQVHARDDRVVSADQATTLTAAWGHAGRSTELHLYARGGHGFGMHQQGLPSDGWFERFSEWLSAEQLPLAAPTGGDVG